MKRLLIVAVLCAFSATLLIGCGESCENDLPENFSQGAEIQQEKYISHCRLGQ